MKRLLAATLITCMLLTGAWAEGNAPEAAVSEPPAAEVHKESPKQEDTPEEIKTEAPQTPHTEAPTAGAGTETPAASVQPGASETPTPAAGEIAGETPASGDEAETDATPAPEGTPAGEETPGKPVVPADAEAWMVDPADTAQIIAGKLEVLLRDFTEKTEATVYVRAKDVVKIKDKTVDDLKKTTLLPDPDTFGKDKYEVCLSATDPAQTAPAGGEAPAETALYIWVRKKNTPEKPNDQDKPVPTELDIFVAAENYVPGAWSNAAPVFTLSGIPAGSNGYSYAAIAYDEKFIVLSSDVYTARDEGEYTLRFAILDSLGDVVALSAKYELKLDFTPPTTPVAALVQEGKPVFTLSSTDARSGLDAFSVDGGATWTPADETGVYTHTGKLGQVYEQGLLLARDLAGNVAAYPASFEIPKPMVYPGGGGGGGGGGGHGAGSGKTIKHTGDADVDTTPYDTLKLEVSGEPMRQLTLGGETLDLSLALDSAENLAADALPPPEFTAKLTVWGESEPAADAQPDTLILTAEIDPAIAGEYTYLWRFNGTVYRMLLNSGVDYLVLRVGDRVTALSTAGFTAGTEYTRLKASGVSTRRFDYSVWMTASTTDMTLRRLNVEADVEGEVYPLTDDATQGMYYYDLYYGPTELLRAPFGAWTQEEETT